jgi:hypothetical protein
MISIFALDSDCDHALTFAVPVAEESRLRMRIWEIGRTRVRCSYRMIRVIRVLSNREGWKVGKDLVYRLYKEEGLGCANGLLGDGMQSCIVKSRSANRPEPDLGDGSRLGSREPSHRSRSEPEKTWCVYRIG